MATESRVQIDKLSESNFGTWKRRIRALLLSKGMAGVISGADEDKDKSDIVMGIIQLYLSDYHLNMADGVATGKALWDKLENTFMAKNTARLLLLRQQLTNLKKEPTETMTEYIARVMDISSNLEAVGHKPEASALTLPVLAGLPKEYSMLITILGTSKDEHTLEEILPMLLQVEQQIINEQETIPIYAMRNMSMNDRRQPRNHRQRFQQQNQQPHAQRRGNSGTSGKRRIPGRCFYSDKLGHLQIDCRTRLADERRTGQRTGALAQKPAGNEWIIDSGATKHLTPYKEQLLNYRSVAPNTGVVFVYGQQAAALGEGDLVLQVKTGNSVTGVRLRNVLHVPEATVSLFSTRQAIATGAEVNFSGNKCFVTLRDQVFLEGISQADGLMVINQAGHQAAFAMAAAASTKETPELWHRRYAHLGYDNLFKLRDNDMVSGISVPAQDFKQQQQEKPFCEACTLAKHHRLPFPHSGSSSSAPLELMHMDVCGPLQVPSPDGSVYLATFTDDYTRLTHVVPLKHKSEVPAAVKATVVLWENQIGRRLKTVRTDRGREYVNSDLQGWFSSKGGPTYSTDSEAAEEATQETQQTAEVHNVSSLIAESSAQDSEQSRYPQRQRKPPAQIYKAQAAQASTPEEPQAYADALQAPDSAQWKLAMDEEMASLQENSTWTLEQQPIGVTPIPVRWIYKVKRDALGNIERYKARLVAKGFMQKEGIDYNEEYAPVSKHTTLRTLLALVASGDMELHQLDIKTAFLNRELEETIYMQQPEGYAEGGPNMVCHLKKSLYGLKQAPRAWHTRLKQELENMGFTASAADPGLFTAQLKSGKVYVLVYVDDILVGAKSLTDIQHVKDRLTGVFKVRDLGEAKYFLGMSVDRNRQARTLKMTQERLATELVSKYGMKEGKTKSTPMSTSVKLVQTTQDAALDKEAYGYSELVGSLLYLSVCTMAQDTFE